MGTRSLTYVTDSQSRKNINMYRQYDGYPAGHGVELANFLKDFTIVNGLSLKETRKVANGMSCLAAQIVAHFKDCAGNIYLYPTELNDVWEEYVYTIYHHNGGLRITIEDYKKEQIFDGTPAQLLEKYDRDE